MPEGFPRLGKHLSQNYMNGILDSIEDHNDLQHGKGVLQGLELSAGEGLEVVASAGALLGRKTVRILTEKRRSVPPSAVRYVWIDERGDLEISETSDDPGGTFVCLGRVTSTESSVTVDGAGRMELVRKRGSEILLGRGLKVCAHSGRLSRPCGSPLDLGGHVRRSVDQIEASGSLRITREHANELWVRCEGGDVDAALPDPEPGLRYELVNAGGVGEIRVRFGETTIATLPPGHRCYLKTIPAISGAAWPSTAQTAPDPPPAT